MKIIVGDALTKLKELESQSVHCCVTSPPYWKLRDYGHEDQVGMEKTPQEYVERLIVIFEEVKRVLSLRGTFWLVIGDSYCGNKGSKMSKGGATHKQASNKGSFRGGFAEGLKSKDLIGIPWRVAFALQDSGWWLRCDIIWNKSNGMMESATDRPTRSHEYVFLLTRSRLYDYDRESILEDCESGPSDIRKMKEGKDRIAGKTKKLDDKINKASKHTNIGRKRAVGNGETRNKRSVWTVGTAPYRGAHFATYPPKLIEPCILAGCPENGMVLDPFLGAGTTGLVAARLQRDFIGIELNPEFAELARHRIESDMPLLNKVEIA